MFYRYLIEVASASSIFLILTILQCGGVLSQNVNSTSLEPVHESGIQSRQLPIRKYFFNAHCEVKCLKDGTTCSTPPSRNEFCKRILHTHWCCQEWLYQKPIARWFLDDCRVACLAYFVCPQPRCRYCAEINWNHRCCRDCDGSEEPKPPTTPEPGATLPTVTESPIPEISTNDPLIPTPSICPDVADTVCKTFDGRPTECRLATNCAYNCAAGICQNIWEVAEKPCFDSCWNHCYDRCGCKQRFGCLYDDSKGICSSQLERYCRFSHFVGTECGRKDAFYLVGGSICQNRVEVGHCDLEIVLISANLGSDKASLDSQGIEYRPETEIKKRDALELSQSIIFSLDNIKTEHLRDKDLFSTAVVGDRNTCINASRECIDYSIPTINWDGNYELALRMHEGVYDTKGTRRFSAYFANVELFSELDIIAFTSEQFRPLDLLVNFKVYDHGKMIKIKGHHPSYLGSHTTLSLCKGHCAVDNSFLVSAFHIIKQKEFKNPEPCDTTKPLEECDDFHPGACRRADAIYSFRGRFCKSSNQAGNCYQNDQILAINFNGETMVDSRGIEYLGDDGKFGSLDEHNIKRNREIEGVEGIQHDGDKKLFSGIIFGDPNGNKYGCIWYRLQFCQDGRYEIAFRLVDDESDAPGKRKFNIMIGEKSKPLPLFSEVDIFYLSGGQIGKAVDVHINIEIVRSIIYWRGLRYEYDFPLLGDKTAWIALCSSSSCTNAEKTNFMAAAMSVIAFGQDPSANEACAIHNGDACSCRQETFCEYDVVSERCLERNAVCTPKCRWKETKDCRRGGNHIYYADAGKVCPNIVDTMNEDGCIFDTVIAVNMGGDEATQHQDVYGIRFQRDNEVPYEDPNDSLLHFGWSQLLKEGVPSSDLALYGLHNYGSPQSPNDSCVTYQIPVKTDGLYQLSLKTGETYHSILKKRVFSILFNDQYIVMEYEPAQYRLPPYGFDLNVNFEVYGGGTMVQIDGHPPSHIVLQSIPLKLCFGSCSWADVELNWILGAFSVIRFNIPISCARFHDNPCDCRSQANCEYNVVTKECVERSSACRKAESRPGECRRAGEHVYYAVAGVVCRSTQAQGQCEVEKVVVADNYDYPGATDATGISFHSGNTLRVDDPMASLRYGGHDESVQGVPAEEYPLYSRLAIGTKSAAKDSCLTYYVPTVGDGSYELRLRPFQIWHTENGRQEFDILLNGQYIVQVLDIHRVRPFPNVFELNVHYKVMGGETKIQLSGHPPSEITTDDKTIPLTYCYGSCNWPNLDPGYSMAAMSVVKFKICSDFNDKPCSCWQAGSCVFNAVTKKCLERSTACNHVSYGNDNTCWRGGKHVFYSHGGVVCPKLQGSGNCQVEKTMLAINFNGDEHTDSKGITYQKVDTVSFDDPSNTIRSFAMSQVTMGKMEVPSGDIPMYSAYIYGNHAEGKDCVTISVPHDGDGEYELSIKTGNIWKMDPYIRSYSFKFNDLYVVQEFDVRIYRPYPQMLDLNIQFIVSDGGTNMQMRGYPESTISTTDIPLKLCFGSCKGKYGAWQISAMSVVKFKT